jgi:hypothetical protein
VKPANLLLDGRGCLWVDDFGLAQVQHGDAGLTATGDLVGTLRYMSPEQALAQRVPIDHRTDVYSLGATLYELLTLAPAFGGSDRQELLRQIAFEEPAPPRRRDRNVPAELEVIVLKAMEKNPTDRYTMARDMADDLRRFLEDRPIQARRPSPWQRLRKWGRRHKALVGAVTAVTLLAGLLLGGAGGWWAWQQATVEREALLALQETTRFQEQGKWPEALSAARRAEGLTSAGFAGDDLRRRAEQRRRELELVAKLEEIRLLNTSEKGEHLDTEQKLDAYAQASREYGINVSALSPEEAGARIRATGVAVETAAALDDWAMEREGTREKANRPGKVC